MERRDFTVVPLRNPRFLEDVIQVINGEDDRSCPLFRPFDNEKKRWRNLADTSL